MFSLWVIEDCKPGLVAGPSEPFSACQVQSLQGVFPQLPPRAGWEDSVSSQEVCTHSTHPPLGWRIPAKVHLFPTVSSLEVPPESQSDAIYGPAPERDPGRGGAKG